MKSLLISCLFLLSTMNAFAASNRTADVLADDSYDRLQKISELKSDLHEKEVALTALETDLNAEILKASKQKSAKVLLGVGAVGLAATALLIKFPLSSGKGIIGGVGDVIVSGMLVFAGGALGTVVTVTGAVKYVLNSNDVLSIQEKVKVAKAAIQTTQKNLNREVVQLCKIDSRHELCY
jgi:hypothetical protein